MLLSTEQTRLSLTLRRTFLFSRPQLSFLRPQKLTCSPPHEEKVIFECCISFWIFMKHSHLSIFSPLHPWQTVERERVRAHFQTLPLLLYFTLLLNVSPEASDRHASVYELTLNRWGEEIGERGGGERQRAAASCKFMTSFFFPGHYVQHALTSLISFIYWQRRLPERKQRARSPHPPDPYSVTHCLICFIGVDARWAASEGRN